jgi:tetratricopeptide (TPR) repeat protein
MGELERSRSVTAWEETVIMPTYVPAAADLNPMFLERRVDQGASGRVYPNPFTDRLSCESEEKAYRAVFLENEYLRLMILPEIGGRIHEGLDKTNGYHFIYRQQVVKPALIGRFGPWISGGVEFNWPQHHRPSTFLPVHHLIERSSDGSVTAWLSEHDPMERMKGMVGICLYPDKAYLEMKVQLYNRTPMARTFLWWVNLAAHAHDLYQVVFPPDVTIVTDHSRRAMCHYPLARGSYYDVDYSQGVDISWYKNVPGPTSCFVWESVHDFFGGYDHRLDAGVIHVADHHISPGKKMFTWGTGEFGLGWERNLTDADGPYIELMSGVYTDNQPDFSWLQPYETKVFSQYWYPVRRIGPAKRANRRAAVNMEVRGGRVRLGVAVTEALDGAQIRVSAGERILLQEAADLAPAASYLTQLDLSKGLKETDLLLCVCDHQGREVIRYAPKPIKDTPLPEPRTPPPPPERFESIEELYLTGLHLEQYHHPTIDPEPYWEAALARDPTDVRCNNALGLSHLRRGNAVQAEAHFLASIDKLTRRNPNPRDGEPYYNLGLALKLQGRFDEAYSSFYKAIWDQAWQAAGYYSLAEIDCRRTRFSSALDHLDRALVANTLNTKARNLKAAVLRRLGCFREASALAEETIALDPLDMWARYEMALQSHACGDVGTAEACLSELDDLMQVSDWLVEVQLVLDIACDYTNAGLWDEARDLLEREIHRDGAASYAMAWYALGYCVHQLGREREARSLFAIASRLPTDYCFPARLEELEILRLVQSIRPEDGHVAYYLGNLYFDKKRYDEAIASWELAAEQGRGFSIPWRNLGIAYYNVRHDHLRAIACYDTAIQINPGDARVFSELGQLLRMTGASSDARLARLEGRLDLVQERDDLSIDLATLYNQTGQPQRALDLIASKRFHPWEGGTGRVWTQYVTAHFLIAQSALDAGQPRRALDHLEAAQACPDHLGERRHLLWPVAHLDYFAGLANRALGDDESAAASFQRVLETRMDSLTDAAYYRALALRELDREMEAEGTLQEMLTTVRLKLEAEPERSFADSVPQLVFDEDDVEVRQRACYSYLIGLAHLGLGHRAEASAAFHTTLQYDPNHIDAIHQLWRMGPEEN